MAAPPVHKPQPAHPYRMKDLCQLTGLSRQAIHFYVQQGLVPPGHKTGRNMAYYSEDHLQRLKLIRRLQHEKFLPLKAIKAVLEGEIGQFDSAQRAILQAVKSLLTGSLLPGPGTLATVDAAELATRHGVPLDDVRRLAEIGFIGLIEAPGESPRIAADDTWAIEIWGQIRALGFTRDRGFAVDDLTIYEEAVSDLFMRELTQLLPRFSKLPAQQAAEMLADVLPLIHALLTRYHAARVRNFITAME